MPQHLAEDDPAPFLGRAHVLFAAKIMDAKDMFATHGSQMFSNSKRVETADPNLSWIQSLLVETIVADDTPAAVLLVSAVVMADQLTPLAEGEG